MKRWIVGSFLILGLAAPAPGKSAPEAPLVGQTDEKPTRPDTAGAPAGSEVRTIHAPKRAIASALTQAVPAAEPKPSPGGDGSTSIDSEDPDPSSAPPHPAGSEVPVLHAPLRQIARVAAPPGEPPTPEPTQAAPAAEPKPSPGGGGSTSIGSEDPDPSSAPRHPAGSEVPALHAPLREIARVAAPPGEPPTPELTQAAPPAEPKPSPGGDGSTSIGSEDPDPSSAPPDPAAPEAPMLRAPVREAAEAPATRSEPPPLRLAQTTQAEPPEPGPPGQRLISLDFKDADLANLLRILAAESEKNIVAGEDVTGKITIALKNVTWELALDTILETQGLRKIEKDNIIRIVSLEQLAKEEEAKARAAEAKLKAEAEIRTKIAEAELREQELKERKLAAEAARAEAEARGPLREEMIRLSYADPEIVVETLIGILGIPPEGTVPVEPAALPGAPPGAAPAPPGLFGAAYGAGTQAQPSAPGLVSVSAEVLAKGITIRAHKPTNSVFVRHYEADLERIKKLIREELDIRLPQVKIEARMEILEREDLFAIGIELSGGGAGTVGTPTLLGQGFSTRAPVRPVTIVGTGADKLGQGNTKLDLAEFLPVDPATGLPTGGNLINFPIAALLGGAAAAGGGGFIFGIVANKLNINLALEALRTLGKTETLARPEVVTVENNKATISLGEEIPFATISLEGTKIEFKEALLKLDVTPTVIREGDVNKIKMKVVVENNSRGTVTVDLGTAGAPPVINKRRAETEVLVKEGDHLVIGGVTTTLSLEQTRKVPLLGDIPLLGWLFKQKGTQDLSRELVVFITPTVVEPATSTSPRSQTQ